MTIEEANEFYKYDTEDYELGKNPKFISWFKKAYKDVNPILDIEGIQKLVHKVINWYEIKFPNRYLKLSYGVVSEYFMDIKDISKHLTLEQLKYRLSSEELETLNCYYRHQFGGKSSVLIDVIINNSPTYIFASEEGIVQGNEYSEMMGKKDTPVTLEQLYNFLISLDLRDSNLSDLKRCVDIHNKDIDLKKLILGAIVKGLIFSKETTPEFGLIRAKAFISDIGETTDNLILSPNARKMLTQKH